MFQLNILYNLSPKSCCFRNSCSMVTSQVWLQTWFCVAFLLCWLVIFSCSISSFRIMKLSCKEQKELTVLSIFPDVNRPRQNSVCPIALTSANKIVFSVLFLYIILILPHSLSVIVIYFFEMDFVPDPWFDPRSTYENSNQIVFTSEFDSLFIYFRYIYNVVVPIIILTSDKDIRRSCRHLFSCKKNAISSQNLEDKFSLIHFSDSPIKDMKIPVLFATSSGLYLRYQSQTNYGNENHSGSTSSTRTNFRLMSILCDSNATSNVEPSLYFVQRKEFKLNDAEEKRNVRFSSKVDAISPVLNTTEMSNFSDTRVVQNPIFVKADVNNDQSAGRTYNKI